MTDAIDTYESHGLTVRIEYDSDPELPRDWENVGTFWTFDRNYHSPDKCPSTDPREALESLAADLFPDHKSIGELTDAALMELIERRAIILPVFKFEHGGVAYSTGAFGDPWDSGQVGWIFASLATARHEWGVGKSKRLTAAARAKAIAYLEGEVETYSQYANGEVYGYVVENGDGDTLDSCWGMFGFDYAKAEAEAAAKAEAAALATKRTARLKDLIRNRVPLDARAAALG